MSAAKMSLAAIVVVVKSVKVVLWITVPLAMETPEVLIEFEPRVGIAVPEATFKVLTVAVPASTSIFQPVMVQPMGTVWYPRIPVERAEPPGVP